jgi:FkbM family methyltransferase
MVFDVLRKMFRSGYYAVYGGKGKNIKINNEDYTISAYVARGINSAIDETPLKLLINLAVFRNTDTLFDIGGNVGVIALMLAKKMKPGSVIHSFEPAPLSFKFLEDTARVQKGNAKIIAVNYAVGNNNNKLYFTNDGNSCTNHISAEKVPGTISVDGITIDSYSRDNKVVPQVIKIDVEGAEYWALDGMKTMLKNNNCSVLVEIHRDYLEANQIDGNMFGNIISFIGYKVYDEKGEEINGKQIIDKTCVILSKGPLPQSVFKVD